MEVLKRNIFTFNQFIGKNLLAIKLNIGFQSNKIRKQLSYVTTFCKSNWRAFLYFSFCFEETVINIELIEWSRKKP